MLVTGLHPTGQIPPRTNPLCELNAASLGSLAENPGEALLGWFAGLWCTRLAELSARQQHSEETPAVHRDFHLAFTHQTASLSSESILRDACSRRGS